MPEMEGRLVTKIRQAGKKASNWSRTPRKDRGYGVEWDRVRQFVMRRDYGLCQCENCKGPGVMTPATEVHHIVGKTEGARRGWTQAQIDDPSNLIAINSLCHKGLTGHQ